MKKFCQQFTSIAILVCLLTINVSTAKDIPQVDVVVSKDSSSLELSYQLCGSCDESFDKSVCTFSGDICTELLAPLNLDYSYMGCLNDRNDSKLTDASIQDIAKLTDYLFRGGRQLTCDDLAFLSNSQILDGVNVVTLTEVISELFERAETAAAVR